MKWIFERTAGTGAAAETPIGYIPSEGALDISGLNLSPNTMKELFKIDKGEWMKDANEMGEYLKIFGNKVPQGIQDELNNLKKRLSK